MRTTREVLAKFSEYAVLGYSGAGVVVDKHTPYRISKSETASPTAAKARDTRSDPRGRNLVAKVPAERRVRTCLFHHSRKHCAECGSYREHLIGERVAVIGLGLVGQLIAQLGRLQGGFVVATDLKSDRVALALGAD